MPVGRIYILAKASISLSRVSGDSLPLHEQRYPQWSLEKLTRHHQENMALRQIL